MAVRFIFLIFLGLLTSLPLFARNILQDFKEALAFDPQYQTALADAKISERTAKQSRSVFYPEATFNTQRIATDTSGRFSFNLTQPLLDWERFVMWSQAAPQEALGEINLQVKQQELATRVLKAATDIILANESLRLNEAKLKAVSQQAERATRMLQLGQGTLTDLRDIQVKLSQAKAQQFSFEVQLQIALKQYASIIGVPPVSQEFVLPKAQGTYSLKSLLEYTDLALRASPTILAARLNLQLAESNVSKIKASLLPSVTAQYAYTQNSGLTNQYSYVGVGMSVPLKAGTIYSMNAAEATVIKTKESLRETESKIRLDSDRLRALVESGSEALKIQIDAIEAAELSVDANTKSYQGGVRTAVDVLNAIQTVFQVKSEYVTLATTQAQNILALMLLSASMPQDAVVQAQSYLFMK
jgi:protease secretion system outer membrane protein